MTVEPSPEDKLPLPTDRHATAFHEAGHAVIALAWGRSVQRVSILPNQLRLGQCELKKARFRSSEDATEIAIMVYLGGVAAEARLTGCYHWEAAATDLRFVRSLTLPRAGSARQADRLERKLLDKVKYTFHQPGVWRAVEMIAAELLKKTTLSGRAARHLFDRALSQAESKS